MIGEQKIIHGHYWNTSWAYWSIGIAIVAVITEGIDWAAYIGADDGQSSEACYASAARNGERLSEVDARHFFQVELPYRY